MTNTYECYTHLVLDVALALPGLILRFDTHAPVRYETRQRWTCTYCIRTSLDNSFLCEVVIWSSSNHARECVARWKRRRRARATARAPRTQAQPMCQQRRKRSDNGHSLTNDTHNITIMIHPTQRTEPASHPTRLHRHTATTERPVRHAYLILWHGG